MVIIFLSLKEAFKNKIVIFAKLSCPGSSPSPSPVPPSPIPNDDSQDDIQDKSQGFTNINVDSKKGHYQLQT